MQRSRRTTPHLTAQAVRSRPSVEVRSRNERVVVRHVRRQLSLSVGKGEEEKRIAKNRRKVLPTRPHMPHKQTPRAACAIRSALAPLCALAASHRPDGSCKVRDLGRLFGTPANSSTLYAALLLAGWRRSQIWGREGDRRVRWVYWTPPGAPIVKRRRGRPSIEVKPLLSGNTPEFIATLGSDLSGTERARPCVYCGSEVVVPIAGTSVLQRCKCCGRMGLEMFDSKRRD